MNHQDPEDQPGPELNAELGPDQAAADAPADAAALFASCLADQALAEPTVRLQAILYARGSLDELLSVERALTAGWPTAADAVPPCELIWATENAAMGRAALQLSAFDGAGRTLLRRDYRVAELLKPVELHHG